MFVLSRTFPNLYKHQDDVCYYNKRGSWVVSQPNRDASLVRFTSKSSAMKYIKTEFTEFDKPELISIVSV